MGVPLGAARKSQNNRRPDGLGIDVPPTIAMCRCDWTTVACAVPLRGSLFLRRPGSRLGVLSSRGDFLRVGLAAAQAKGRTPTASELCARGQEVAHGPALSLSPGPRRVSSV